MSGNSKKPKTWIYVDGFNMYYGACRPSNIRWVDLDKLCNLILKNHDIDKIKYFTARVSGKYDVDKPVRQQTYWRALKTLPNLEIIEGSFISKNIGIQVTSDVSIKAKVMEEKSTDVNIATQLIHDAHLGRFDVAAVITNDSDLVEPIKLVKNEIGKQIGIINPCRRASKVLTAPNVSDFQRQIRHGALKSAIFPTSMADSKGKFIKPKGW